jgi:hypothetical protein
MATQTIQQAETLQDSLRSVRAFVSNIGGQLVDQSMASIDASVHSAPYQFQTVTQAGAAVEGSGQTLTTTQGAPQIAGVSNTVLLVLAAAAVLLILRK